MLDNSEDEMNEGEGQAPTGEDGQAPSPESHDPKGEDYYKRRRDEAVAEAKKAKARAKAAEARLAKREQEDQKAAEERAKEQGKFQELYDASELKFGKAKAAILREKMLSGVIGKGVPADIAKMLSFNTDGLTVTDDLQVEGDLDKAIDAIAGPLLEKIGEKPETVVKGQPATVISSRPNDKPAPQKKGIGAWKEQLSSQKVLENL